MVKTQTSVSKRQDLVVPFALFGVTAMLLAVPLGEPLRGLAHGLWLSDASLAIASTAAAWILRGSGVLLMGWLANSRAGGLRIVLARYLLFVFLLYFALERLAADLSVWRPALALAHSFPWIQVLSAVAVVLAAALALPQVRGIRAALAGEAQEHARFLAAAENTLDDFYIFDGVYDEKGEIADFRFRYINPNAERRLHTPREKLIGKILTEERPFMIKSGLIEKYREVVRTGVPFTTEVYLDDELIKATWLNVQVVKLGTGIAITSRDVTENRRLTDRIQHMAHHDQLTGLANRALFHDRAQLALLRARGAGQKVAVFMLDIDSFKLVNDTLGHYEGDALLVVVARRLLASVRETDTVARMGGDEFVVLMPDFPTVEQIRRCGENILRRVAQPVELDGRAIKVTASLGASIYPDDGVELKELLKKADDAMYAVKHASRDGLRLYADGIPTADAAKQRKQRGSLLPIGRRGDRGESIEA